MNTIEKSLTEIQKNLEKLESARNQVLDVTKSGKEITLLMIDLVKNIKEVQVIISGESDSFIKGFVKNEKKVDDAVNGVINKWQSSISSFDKSLNTFTNQISEKINQSGDNITFKTNSFLEKQDIAFNANISNLENSNKTLNEFKKSLIEFDFYEQIKPIEQKIEEFERLVSKRIHESYKETTKNTNQIANDTLNAIQDLNLPIRIDKLDSNTSGIPTVIQNLQSSLDNLETTIDGKLKDSLDKQVVLLSTFEKKIETIAKKQQTYTFITWLTIIIIGLIIYLKK
jgi:predicted translin family RNA/ssDNA-binding protein